MAHVALTDPAQRERREEMEHLRNGLRGIDATVEKVMIACNVARVSTNSNAALRMAFGACAEASRAAREDIDTMDHPGLSPDDIRRIAGYRDTCYMDLKRLMKVARKLPDGIDLQGIHAVNAIPNAFHGKEGGLEHRMILSQKSPDIAPDTWEIIEEGCRERRELCVSHGTENAVREYLLYMREVRKFLEAQPDEWSTIPYGILNPHRNPFVYKRGGDGTSLMASSLQHEDCSMEVFDMRMGLWSPIEPKGDVPRMSAAEYGAYALKGDDPLVDAGEAMKLHQHNTRVERVLKGQDNIHTMPRDDRKDKTIAALMKYREIRDEVSLETIKA